MPNLLAFGRNVGPSVAGREGVRGEHVVSDLRERQRTFRVFPTMVWSHPRGDTLANPTFCSYLPNSTAAVHAKLHLHSTCMTNCVPRAEKHSGRFRFWTLFVIVVLAHLEGTGRTPRLGRGCSPPPLLSGKTDSPRTRRSRWVSGAAAAPKCFLSRSPVRGHGRRHGSGGQRSTRLLLLT